METGFHEIRRRAPWPEEAGEKSAGVGEGENGEGKEEALVATVRFQGLRVAYFTMDKDSVDGKVVLNRIVGIKEDLGKGA